ncbi:MAG TPA: succinate dehydrogenase cytochrome b subunit [Longimicrobiales bacterium]
MRRVGALYGSSVGKKIAMALSGVILVLFVIFHLYGNLKAFYGPEVYNAYAEGLRAYGAPIFGHGHILWILRIGLIAAATIHIVAAVQLVLRSNAARDAGYRKYENLAFSYASRTMRWGGVIILLFVIYHLMHFTWGNAHPDFIPGDVYHNFVVGFRMWPVALVYIAAMIPLGLHLYHGIWSMFQTLGANNPRFNRWRRPLAGAIATIIVLGNISFPIAVLTGIIA